VLLEANVLGKKIYAIIIPLFFLFIQCSFLNKYSLASNETESKETWDIGEANGEKKQTFSKKKSEIHYERFFEEKKHWCGTMVINCSDFRFAKATQKFINEKLGYKGDYDYFSIPGSIRNMLNKQTRKLVMDTFGISVHLHHVKRVVIIAHEDCIGYGGEAFSSHEEEYKKITKDLKKARKLMRFRFREMEVYLFYGKIIDSDGERKIEYEQIL